MNITTNPSPAHSSASFLPGPTVPENMPLGGLGLPLSGHSTQVFSERFCEALERVTLPPAVNIGIDFLMPLNGGNPDILGLITSHYFFGWDHQNEGAAPDPSHPALQALDEDGVRIAHLLPIIDLPGTGDFYVYREHFLQLLWHLTETDVALEDLPRPPGFPDMQGIVLPYRLPSAQGPVTPDTIKAFTQCFPGVGAFLLSSLPWTGFGSERRCPAAIANSVASRALGIPVDLRIGQLVMHGVVDYAISYASGEVEYRDGDTLEGRIWSFVDAVLPTVDKYDPSLGEPRIGGAAWSCMLDAIINDTLLWSNVNGRRAALDDFPALNTAKGKRAWIARVMKAAAGK